MKNYAFQILNNDRIWLIEVLNEKKENSPNDLELINDLESKIMNLSRSLNVISDYYSANNIYNNDNDKF